ncbi:hypothetical protein BDW22DRAFT_1481165 [Trametopsis cervina]|nr:hypothetical protein BDW22DRAFT_1481165 [Trametopsis cervina]
MAQLPTGYPLPHCTSVLIHMPCWPFSRRSTARSDQPSMWHTQEWRTPRFPTESPPRLWTYSTHCKTCGASVEEGMSCTNPGCLARTPRHRELVPRSGILREQRTYRPSQDIPVYNPGITVRPENIPRLFPQTPGNGRPRSFVDPDPTNFANLASAIPTPRWQPINPLVGNSWVSQGPPGSGQTILATPLQAPPGSIAPSALGLAGMNTFSTMPTPATGIPASLPAGAQMPGVRSAIGTPRMPMPTPPDYLFQLPPTPLINSPAMPSSQSQPPGTGITVTPARDGGTYIHIHGTSRQPSPAASPARQARPLASPQPNPVSLAEASCQTPAAPAEPPSSPAPPPNPPAGSGPDEATPSTGDATRNRSPDSSTIASPIVTNQTTLPASNNGQLSMGGITIQINQSPWVPQAQLDPTFSAAAFSAPYSSSVPLGSVTPAWAPQVMTPAVIPHLNPTLAPNPNPGSIPHLVWDVSEHPQYAKRLTGRNLVLPALDRFPEQALFPAQQEIEVLVDHHLATAVFWGPIKIKNASGVTVFDVLIAVFDYFQKRLRREEYDYLVGLDVANAATMTDSYEQRCIAAKNNTPLWERDQGVRRIDTFGDNKGWWGMWLSYKSDGRYQLNLGLHSVQQKRMPGSF